MRSIKFIGLFLVLASLFCLTAGCVSYSGAYAQKKGGGVAPLYVEPGFENYLEIENADWRLDKDTQRPFVTVRIRNISDNALRVVYQYYWYDANDVKTEAFPFFEMASPLGKGDAGEICLVALKNNSQKYMLTFVVQPQ